MPAGPEPMMAALIPLLFTQRSDRFLPLMIIQSARNRSSMPMATGASFLARMQAPSHWNSYGQTRPQTEGMELVSRMTQ